MTCGIVGLGECGSNMAQHTQKSLNFPIAPSQLSGAHYCLREINSKSRMRRKGGLAHGIVARRRLMVEAIYIGVSQRCARG